MNVDFLVPVSDVLLAHNELLPKQVLGRNIQVHSTKEGFPSLENVKIAFFGVNENRNASVRFKKEADNTKVRYHLYRMFPGNWSQKMADLGDVEKGATVDDTYFAVKELCASLIRKGIIPVVFGGSQDLTYALYRSYDQLEQMVNVASVDNRFDLGQGEELISSQSYMSRIITEEPNNLFNFANIGFQTFYNAQEEIDLMEKMFFETYRLGAVVKDVTIVEPALRDADMVSFDMSVVKAGDCGNPDGQSPNGLSGMDICAIARYAGISDKVSTIGFFDFQDNDQYNSLVAQALWYFTEGVNYRLGDYPFGKKEALTKYMVPMEEQELHFFKSGLSGRWWVEVPIILSLDNNLNRTTLLPCTHQDYLDACNEKIPERWWRAYRKSVN